MRGSTPSLSHKFYLRVFTAAWTRGVRSMCLRSVSSCQRDCPLDLDLVPYSRTRCLHSHIVLTNTSHLFRPRCLSCGTRISSFRPIWRNPAIVACSRVSLVARLSAYFIWLSNCSTAGSVVPVSELCPEKCVRTGAESVAERVRYFTHHPDLKHVYVLHEIGGGKFHVLGKDRKNYWSCGAWT
jgi:hypothetical protein